MNFRNLLIVVALMFSQAATAQNTRIQVINNCGDVNLQGIDVYINGQLVADDVFFRAASAYLDILAGTQLRVNVTESTAFDTSTAFYSTNLTLSANNKYVIIANGIKSSSGYSPQTPFSLDLYNQAKEFSAQTGFTDVLFFNGSTDGPTFDARTGISTIAKQLGYGAFDNDYFTMPASGTFNIRFTNDRGNQTTHNFESDFTNIGMPDEGVVLLTSGFVNTANNSNGASFGLWAASSSGGPLQEIASTTNREALARIQFIHNTADTAVGKVDILLNSNKKVDTLNYHNASNFMDINVGTNLPLQVAHPGQSPFSTTNVNIDSGKTYIAVIHGLKSDTNYKPLEPFKITMLNDAKEEAAVGSNTEVIFMHGATDASAADIKEGSNSIVTDLMYGSFNSSYTAFPSATNDVYDVDTGNSNTALHGYVANYNAWNAVGKAAVVMLSGFVEPDSNSGGPDIGLWAATSDGGAMFMLPIYTSVEDITATSQQLKVWPNPAKDFVSFEKKSELVDLIVTDAAGRIVLSQKGFTGNKINTSAFADGSYFIFIMDGEQRFAANFIKQ